MMKTVTLTALALLLAVPASSQTKPATKAVAHDLTVKTADGAVYTGTMEMAVEKGKVTGKLHITTPTVITGTVAGTAEKGLMKLEFPYLMAERNCEGSVKIDLTVPAKPGPSKGTMEAVGCGRDASQKLTGSVELVPKK